MPTDPSALADEIAAAYAERRTDVVPPSARDAAFDLATGYAVEAEHAKRRVASGRSIVGRKVGYANKAVWRALKLDTLVWASMYDDTVHHAEADGAALSIDRMCAPKIEPEIVFKLKRPFDAEASEAAAVLDAVEWIALGFEIIDCPFLNWTFTPPDFVAAFGLHAGVVVGTPRHVEPDAIPTLVEQLARFKVALRRDGELVAEGSGRNVLRSPALCLAELAAAMSRRATGAALQAGDLVSSGTLTESQPIMPGQTWTATADDLDLAGLTLRV